MTALELHERMRERDVTVATLARSLPPAVHQRSAWRSAFALTRSAGLVALGEAALSQVSLELGPALAWQIPALLAGWTIVAAGMVGLFILGHDCGHGSFARRRIVNDVVGHLCVSWFFTSFEAWRLGHNYHHARTQLRGQDPDWPEKMLTRDEYERAGPLPRLHARLAFGSPVGVAVGFLVGTFRRTFMRLAYPQIPVGRRALRRLALSNGVMLLASVGTSVWLGTRLGPLALCKYYLVPTWLGMVLGGLFTLLHHSAPGALVFDRDSWSPTAGLASTFDVRFPTWFEALFFHINRHVAHHVAPRVPWYHLPEAAAALQRAMPGLGNERRFSFAHLRAIWRAPLLVRHGDVLTMAAGFDDRGSMST